MSYKRFTAILDNINYSSKGPPTYKDRFWEIREMIEAWNASIIKTFSPGAVNCLDESMSPWTNKYTCPGFMFIPRKPWPFGNEYHSICCCKSGIMWQVELVEGKDEPKQKPTPEFDAIGGNTTSLLLRLCKPIFHTGKLVVLDSGFCVLHALIELKKRGVFAASLIKKRRYWPKYIKGDAIRHHFDSKEVGDADSWPGKFDNENFHVFAMKEPDYVMSLMSTYGTNERVTDCRPTERSWIDDNKKIQKKQFHYPEVIYNHFKFRHTVDDHNGKRHSPICLEYVWATKRWAHRPFSFLLAISEVNTNLAEAFFWKKSDPMPQLEFRKLLARDLINNHYLVQEEEAAETRRSKRLKAIVGHSLVSLPPYRRFSGASIVKSTSKYPQATCVGGHRKIRTYCQCSPGILRCNLCFATHCMDDDNTVIESD